MARISGVNLPLNKRSEIGLHVHLRDRPFDAGKLLDEAGVDRDTEIRDLTEDEVAKLRDPIDE